MKKYYLPIITALLLGSTPFIAPAVRTETKIAAQSINPYIKDNIAREITVKISSEENGGSGVIIARQDNTYLILTNNHVLRGGNAFTINTHDGETYQAKAVPNGIDTDDDLALLQFSSDKDYQTATINTAATHKAKQAILAAGYSAETGKLVTEEGKIERVPDKTLKDGYEIGYSSDIVQGMSGGAILNVDGEVIGINGKSAFPIINTGYTYQDGTKPTPAEIEQLRKLSWGLSVNRLLTQIDPELITAYGLPFPESTDSIETPELTGWLGELEAKAKQISVRIDSSSGANGSGVIIAKEGNTYTVLTANHVLCEKDDANECIDYDYEIVAPDDEKYPVDASTINRQEGVDLAVVRFTSNENYQIAELANYPLRRSDAIFVAGYPQLSNSTPAKWLFSLGYGLDREQGLLDVTDSYLSTDSSGLTSSQGSLSGGYEMVYTSITYGGMSGGAVLDKEGRVIGIHGLAEGETTLDSQDTSQKQIQLGYSLGIPINTFIGLADRLKISSALTIQDNKPEELNRAEIETFQATILGTDIPQGNATAENWLERGNQLWRLQRYDEAVQAFDRAIALKPEFIHLAYYGKGLTLVHGNKNEAALASLELATETEPIFTPAFSTKSAVLKRLNRLGEALVVIETAISLQNDNANLYNQQGGILSNLKRLDEAEVAYNQAIQLAHRSVSYLNRGILYQIQEKFDLALVDYNRAIELNPNLADAYSNRGLLYQIQEKSDLALTDYNRAIELNPNFAPAYNNRGNFCDEQGKSDLALADYNRAIELNPNFAPAYNNRGILFSKQRKSDLALAYYNRSLLYEKQEEVELALADYNQAIKLDPEDANAYYNRGVLYAEQEEVELALADYNQAIKLDPEDANAYYNRGLLYAEQGKFDLALADYNQAIKLDPEDANAYGSLGLLYKQAVSITAATSNFQKAQQIFIAQNNTAGVELISNLLKRLEQIPTETASNTSQNESIDPNDAQAYFDRALEQHKNNEIASAIDNYSQAIELDPNHEKALINRGLLYASKQENELAIEDYNRAIEINSNNSTAYRNRGVVYFQQQEYELAEADWNDAIRLNPDDALAYYNRGLLYQQQQEFDLARRDLESAEKLYIAANEKVKAEQISSVLQDMP